MTVLAVPAAIASCPTCVYAHFHGWWGPHHKGTHCGWAKGCHRSWTGEAQSHCKACHQHFSTLRNFEIHQFGGTCQDASELQRACKCAVFGVRVDQSGPTYFEAPHELTCEHFAENFYRVLKDTA